MGVALNFFSSSSKQQRVDYQLNAVVEVRRFVKSVDEPTWVKLLNEEYQGFASWWRGTTVDEMLELEKNPDFDLEGRFVAEIDGKPVGVLHAHIEEFGEERRGFIKDFCVHPAFRGMGVEEQLLEAAVAELRRHGVKHVRAWTGGDRVDRIRFLERSGFKFAYRTFDMRIDIADMSFCTGENGEVAFRRLDTKVKKDIQTLNWLDNESFEDNPLHVPRTVEETRRLLKDPVLGWQEFYFAVVDGKDVGYIGLGIDEKYNVEHGVKTGYINGIGVLSAYRRKGVGTRLILHGLKVFKAHGMTSASLDTEDTNPTRAITLYEKIGFKVLQEYVTYDKRIAPLP